MKRILLIIISLNIIATHTQAKPARGRSRSLSYSFPSRFHHYRLPRNMYDPSMASVTTENVMAGVRNMGSWIGDQIQYVVDKGKELADSAVSIIKPAMNALKLSDSGSRTTINAWQSGFVNARDQQAKRMRKKVDQKMPIVQVAKQEAEVTSDEPSPSLIISDPAELEPVEAIEEQDIQIPVELPVSVELPAIVQFPEETLVSDQQEPEAVRVELEGVMPLVQEQPEPLPVQEVKEIVMSPMPVMVKEPVSIIPVAPSVEIKRDQAKLPVLQEESKTIFEKEEYQPVRKKRRSVVDPQDIDLFDVQSEFARPSTSANYQPLVQQQPMQFAAAPMYQLNQNQLSNAAMQMQSSAMAMQMQAANLMAQSQQQYMPWQQSQQVPTRPSTMRENTKQEKTAIGMQAIQQVINAGEGAVQHLLLILDLEFDILEHLLAGNTGRRVDDALRERNNAIKKSNQVVIAAYDGLIELATTYGNEDDIGGRLYHYCVRKSKRAAKSPMISPAKKKFLLHMMCVLERYYEIIEKMQRVANLNY